MTIEYDVKEIEKSSSREEKHLNRFSIWWELETYSPEAILGPSGL